VSGRASNRWKGFALLFPIVGMAAATALAQGPGSQRAFFQAWWGSKTTYFPVSGLVAYYSMENVGTNVVEDINNLTGGAGSGVTFSNSFGIIDQGADFDGSTTASILLPYSTLLQPGTGDMSWSFLVYFDASGNADLISDVNLGAAGSEIGMGIGALGASGNGLVDFIASSGSGNYAQYRASGWGLNQWHHFVIVWDGVLDSVEIWRNATNVTASYSILAETTVGNVGSPNAVLISGRPNNTTRNLNGQMDEVLIYNRKLSAGEVEKIYGAYEL